MNILGIGGVLGDAAAAILKDGRVLAAVEEAKLSRGHRHGPLPEESIAACLRLAGLEPNEIDCVALVRPI
ncbi:MAG: carbamoyltransferase, partial [Acidobacteriota bacterium]|nr:carbamoyltransferase [Acidobacteriota bacterium]